MIIRAAQLKVARRHAERLGQQIGDALDNGHNGADGQIVERLLVAWQAFIDQFQDPESGDTVAATHIAESFRRGLGGATDRPELVLIAGFTE